MCSLTVWLNGKRCGVMVPSGLVGPLRWAVDLGSASVRIDARGTAAIVSGSEAEVSRAEVLLERKAGAVSFAARAAQPVADLRAYQPASGSAAPDYSFKAVAGFVADADAAREALKGAGAGGGAGAALAALAAYDDDDDDDS